MKNIIARFINIAYPIDIIRYRILIEVASGGEGCSYNYPHGSTFELNLGQKRDEPCPAAFNSILPSLFAFLKEERLNKEIAVFCPDHRVNVQLGLVNNPSKGFYDSQNSSIECMPESDIKIKVAQVSPKCPMHHSEGKEYNISDILDKAGVRCLTAFHVLFPYYLTLSKRGTMPGYYVRNKYAAIFQCPSIKNKIEMMIQKDKKGTSYTLCVLAQRNKCPKLLHSGQKIKLKPKKPLVCLYMLGSISPYVNILKFDKRHETISISCPACNGGSATFELS